MKKYIIQKFLIVLITLIYTTLLFMIISGRQPYENSNLSIIGGLVVFITAYVISALMTPKSKISKQAQEENRANDERNRHQKKNVAYIFLLILTLIIPILLFLLDNMEVNAISIKSIASIFIGLVILYNAILYIVNKF
ncbi:hypothetical protein F1F76_15845 [Listeria monocytogenes]|uniref:hypothetical protein n=1 Tax=Listeria TaxID=1637 RepID=UPI0008698872|nr:MULTISPECIES: hypothetical protein [Listeria]EAC3329947.1 hypothetical protein [Listeria monocytogenes]EAC9329438.1 hypothetical protein [Listeria monocytogenes]EAD8683153.1 hypothetical protein [Listeria monocytogenes]EAD8710694.1 hypothetical protein [Listeria monocytogenes]EAD8716970.1 hypothetical protein [Listeria monocytogenes]